jgi:hypothetical protein
MTKKNRNTKIAVFLTLKNNLHTILMTVLQINKIAAKEIKSNRIKLVAIKKIPENLKTVQQKIEELMLHMDLISPNMPDNRIKNSRNPPNPNIKIIKSSAVVTSELKEYTKKYTNASNTQILATARKATAAIWGK